MYQIEFHIDANEEMRAASQYYEKRAGGLGDEFIDEIERGLSKIQHFPMA